MATLSAASTFPDVLGSYKDNASYIEDHSAAKAKAFITAITILIVHWPAMVQKQVTGTVQLDPSILPPQKEAAEKWLAANPTAGESTSTQSGYSLVSFRNFRR